MKSVSIEFQSGGLKCVGDLFLPDGKGPFPLVLLAHGIAAQRNFGLAPFAERFVNAGMAAMIFDYRNFGDSEGQPREWVHPQRHIEDVHAAIEYAKKLTEIDPQRIALWGTSFGGGHVISVSSQRRDIRAVVAQVPFVDGLSTLRMMKPGYLLSANMEMIKNLLSFGRPHYVPVVAQPGTFALMNTPESYPGYEALVPKSYRPTWPNRAHGSILRRITFYRPIQSAPQVGCPALVVYAEKDSLIDPNTVRRAAGLIPDCETLGLPVGHFEVYRGEPFETVVKRETEFLSRHLGLG